MSGATMGHQTRFGLGLTASAAATREFDVLSNGLVQTKQHVQSDGMRGTVERYADSVVEGTSTVGGTVVLEPRPDDWDFLWPLILGGGSAGSYVLAQTLPTFYAHAAKGMNNPQYRGCVINSAVIRSAANQPLQVALDIQGETREPGIAFPSIAATLSVMQPYIHHQLVFDVDGTEFLLDNLEISILNQCKLDRFFNSQNRQGIPRGDYIVRVSADFPYTTDEADLYDIAVAGLPATATWTNGTVSMEMAFGTIQAPLEEPPVQSRGAELGFRVNFQARKTASDATLVVTNDSTV